MPLNKPRPEQPSPEDELEHFPTKDRLHSDVLEEKYGPVEAKVLRHDDVKEVPEDEYPVRESHLVDGQDISRTYALTFLTYDEDNPELYEIDTKIRNGGMIGKTFRNYGYEIRKNVIDVFTLQLTDRLREEFDTDEDYGKARVSEFYAKKQNDEPTIYGRVLELYTPDFRGPVINQVDLEQVNPSTEILEKNGISRNAIWKRLDKSSDGGEWKDKDEAYEQAKEDSLPEVFKWRERIENFINSK